MSGRVLGEDGSPIEGAVVASSAGGRALSDARGDFRLAIDLSRGVDQLELNASAEAQGLFTRASVSVPRTSGTSIVPVAALQLSGASACDPRWLPTFGGEPGVSSTIEDFVVFDDGSGAALYACGSFAAANGVAVNYIGRWDGSHWSALGSGLEPSSPEAVIGHDDGSGPALYVDGRFAGGPAGTSVSRWNGTSWSAVGTGFGAGTGARAFAVYDDGSGPALYAGTTYGHVFKWDGVAWSELPDGPDDSILTLESFDVGDGPSLYAGGFFNDAPLRGVARWNGTSWLGVGGGRGSIVNCLIGHDDGSGPALYAGGTFAQPMSRWNGVAWSTFGSSFNSTVRSMAVHDDGSGPELYAGGLFTHTGSGFAPRIARWDGSNWSPLGSGASLDVTALKSFDAGTGPRLYAGGTFMTMGGLLANRFASWDGTSWMRYGNGLSARVTEVVVHDDGAGPALFVAGALDSADGVVLNGIGRWDESGLTALGTGLGGGIAVALAVHDDGLGGGPAVYVGGTFSSAGGSAANGIAKWDGTSWSPLGNGISGVGALESFDDGSGPALYAGGNFSSAGGVPAVNMARWNGTSWEALPGASLRSVVLDLLVFDDGSGPALYAAGGFSYASSGGASTELNHVARWNGAGWSPLGDGVNNIAHTLASFDDGSGPALYVGGQFQLAGGDFASRVARWNGTSWSPLGAGLHNGYVGELGVHDDRSGPVLYASGTFQFSGSTSVNHIARWDGTQWLPLGSGLNAEADAFASFDDGSGPALFVGGEFSSAIDSSDSYLAKWGREETLLDFSSEDDFATALVDGQALSTPPEFGHLLSLSSAGPNAGAAIFDSTPGGPNDPSQDLDLLVGRGNVLILQTDANTTQSVPGVFDRPNDDSDGGSLVFQFADPVMAMAVDLIDIDSGAGEASAVILRDQAGLERRYTVPLGWTGDHLTDGTSGVRTLSLVRLDPQPGHLSTASAYETPGFASDHVIRIEVQLGGSGAVDDLRWCAHQGSNRAHAPRAVPRVAPSSSPGSPTLR